MSPELLAPEMFGMERSRPTKSSDCYSLGMVVYEIVSGKKPFQETQDTAVLLKIVQGARPRRYEGFVDSLWGMMEECWTFQPNGRPSIEDVLQRLEMCSSSPGTVLAPQSPTIRPFNPSLPCLSLTSGILGQVLLGCPVYAGSGAAEGATGTQRSRGDHAPQFDASPLANRDLDAVTPSRCGAWGDTVGG